MLDPDTLDVLACPRCKGEVVPDDEHTSLTCEACRLRYRVVDDLPIMMIEEAESLDQGADVRGNVNRGSNDVA
jgi:uncharacterized protein YbaR (Trm112 family)